MLSTLRSFWVTNEEWNWVRKAWAMSWKAETWLLTKFSCIPMQAFPFHYHIFNSLYLSPWCMKCQKCLTKKWRGYYISNFDVQNFSKWSLDQWDIWLWMCAYKLLGKIPGLTGLAVHAWGLAGKNISACMMPSSFNYISKFMENLEKLPKATLFLTFKTSTLMLDIFQNYEYFT